MKPLKFSKENREYIKWSKNLTEVRIIPETRTNTCPVAQLQVDMDGNTAQGVYANMAAVTHTGTEFVFD